LRDHYEKLNGEWRRSVVVPPLFTYYVALNVLFFY
jgi:hypothetical protein